MKAIPLELLAPARDIVTAREAILHGADAVYIGGPSHGARAAAANSIGDIAELTDYAHLFGVRVYVTLNTIIYQDEIRKVEETVHELYKAGVDALIVQDMSLLRMHIPPIDLHASTQCDIRTPEKARFLADCGFSQLVLPREFSLDEIRRIRSTVPADTVLEAFVHGALCVSYSGDCQASCITCGRSANRGECAQICRLAYNLEDSQGNVLIRDRHLLSLRDLCRISDLGRMADAGISSFKIEGRLKDTAYVKNVTASYRQALDAVIEASDGKYTRASHGECKPIFTPDVNKSFNRGFTPYFIDGRPSGSVNMANPATPKWIGEPVAKVSGCDGKRITVKGLPDLANGDGLGYFDKDGRFTGFRLNRVEGNTLFPATQVKPDIGTVLYRNSDIRYNNMMAKNTSSRLIDTRMRLEYSGGHLWLTLEAGGTYVTASIDCATDTAHSPQRAARGKALSKLGGTPLSLKHLDDSVDDYVFVPASIVTELRRRAVDLWMADKRATYPYKYRQMEDMASIFPDRHLTYHHNVANEESARFYREHGVKTVQEALECMKGTGKGEKCVMTTRYCLRRELGACLLTADGAKLPKNLYLTSGNIRFRLNFDCSNCRMQCFVGANR